MTNRNSGILMMSYNLKDLIINSFTNYRVLIPNQFDYFRITKPVGWGLGGIYLLPIHD
ncbi:hypothetical protein [Nostoc sp. MG11]|uniref:hypothetical protein n=1 Tax=Nostoc sp. MG11 TaxID=2721166 RepID=UPI00186665E7|nr:hypothetical protein [Nostoc sp. MG11]